MTPRKFEDWLREAIQLAWDDEDEDTTTPSRIRRMDTFEEAGILTHDRGLVVAFDDGSEVQMTLVQSRRARNDRGDDRMAGEPDEEDEQ